MLQVDRVSRQLSKLPKTRLEPTSVPDYELLTALIVDSPGAVFEEISESLFVIARQIPLAPRASSQVDLLALDSQGAAVALAIGDDSGNAQLARALTTAGMIASWKSPDFFARLDDTNAAALRDFLAVDAEEINQQQRLIVIGGSIGVDDVATANWLRDKHGVGVRLIRAEARIDSQSVREYLSFVDLSNVPTIDLTSDELPAQLQPTTAIDYWSLPTVEAEPVVEPAAPLAESPVVELEAQAERVLHGEPLPEAPAAPGPQPVAPVEQLEASPEPPTADPEPTVEIESDPDTSESTAIDRGERRRFGRAQKFRARHLRLDYYGRLLGARLVDFSESGLGVETLSPLPVGSTVGISGELHSHDQVLAISGSARVSHCQPRKDGVCRVGLILNRSNFGEIDTSVQDYGRR